MRRGSRVILAAMIVVAAACGKEKDKSRAEKLSQPLAVPAPAPTDVLTGLPAALPRANPRARLPAWVRESPHFFNRDGRRYASAVGSARIDNPALARTAATDRARAELLRFIKGGTGVDALTGVLTGARVTDAFTSKIRGEVFVRVEIEEPREL